jgi:hypothetical protein
MRDNQDVVIRRLFAEQDQAAHSGDFMRQLDRRIDRQQRVRGVHSVLAIVAGLVLSMLSAPWVAQIAATLVELAADGISSVSPPVFAPLTWLIVGTTLAGCAPVVYLWRTGRW